jgi:hypothetical protein
MRVVMLAMVALCGYQALPAQSSIIIRQHQVGPVLIGASAQSIYAAFRGRSRLIDLGLEGYLTPALELSFPETRVSGGVVAELVPRDNDLVVWRIAVTNPNLRTEKGIGVGSSIAQLRSAYRTTGIGSGEGRVFVMVEELAASFELDTSVPGGRTLWKIRDPQQVPGDVKIASVLLVR